ncbi:hypothetical protein PFICI_12038 [Pestalotiopsis fici W106-1]|uniref:Nuclease PA3 n=1 Tax=Pestalotiopsis fici (strain W106-1 / CGMCC3.15140) TaxID=1229662 RepID=W3WUW7_PESFW|nr:uncharacterized protein PFICI_12038 [Pestalotiopsis fici W106-1]ETS76651.1 hypothetical protein PFICI_12038 [Pestalotiopsis fici W106-1]
MLPKITLGALLPLVSFFGPVHSWQQEVHNQIGFMADEMISTATREMVASILEPEYQGSLGRAAGWADTVRRNPHPYSYTWHFISARDNPPDDCGLYYHRDCQKGGCVVQQISNQTKILEKCLRAQQNGRIDAKGDYNSRSPGKIVCSEALKWVTHFAGDVAQPLHTSNRATGGNSIKVKFNGTDSDLHKVWDRDILYALAPLPNGPPATSLHPFFAGLVSRIRDDAFRSPRSTWAMCDFDARRDTFCPEQWARDSNAIVCDYAYGRYVEGSDLFLGSDRYAQGAMHIVEQQIAKAAFRLTGWLDALVERVSAEADGPDGSSRTDESRDKPRIQSTSNEL